MVIKYLYGLFLLFGVTLSYSQKVSNVTNHQEQSTIIVSYDLETKKPCKITLYVSTNGGTTWQGPLKKVTGDVGVNIISGSKTITWNVLEEFDELKGTNIMFQIRAVDTSFETIKIGNQVWMKKNLDVLTYRNGDVIPEVKDPNEWGKLTTGAWCYYNNDPKNGKIYGKLYNWYAVNDPRGLAPVGYHVPSDKEWSTLITYLGGDIAGGKLKEEGTLHRESPNTSATNSTGFTGLPAGYRYNLGTFSNIRSNGLWWSSSETNTMNAWGRNLSYNVGVVYRGYYDKGNGLSVRCIKDSNE